MTAPRVRITKTMVARATAPPGTSSKAGHAIHDAFVPGLRVVVYPSGRKTWVLYHRTHDGRQRRPVLGDALALLPDAARALARQLLGDVAHGEDPSTTRSELRSGATFGELLDRYRDFAETYKADRSLEEDARMIEKVLRPKLGKRPAVSISQVDVLKIRAALASTPVKFNRVRALVSHVFTMAAKWGEVPSGFNPCAGVDRYREQRRHRPLSELEAARLGVALKALERRSPVAVAALRFMLLVGCRPSEALGLTWPQVDLDGALIRIPCSKTGRRILYLGGAAVALLERLERLADNPHVFPSPKLAGRPLRNVDYTWGEARRLAGLEGEGQPRLYDAGRHTFGDAAVVEGLSDVVLASLLGHSNTRTTAVYRDVRADPARRGAEAVSGRIAGLLGLEGAAVEFKKGRGEL